MTGPTEALSTEWLYESIRARILAYAPVGPAFTTSLSAVLAGRVWYDKPADNAVFPAVVITVKDRAGYDSRSFLETFVLEVQCYNRPRNYRDNQQNAAIADQIQAALTGWLCPSGSLAITGLRMRMPVPAAVSPADRDIQTQFMMFDGVWEPAYVSTESGSS